MSEAIEKAWNKTKGDGDPEFAQVSPDFRAKLQSVYADAQAGAPESGIAGLEKFEAEIRKGVKSSGETDGTTTGAPSTRDNVARQAEETPQGSGAQDSEKGQKAKALKDAAGAQARVEHDEVNSPSFPSAARPLAAESPANASAESGTPTAAKKAAKKTAAKSGSKKASKKASK
jgi:hypothetical protein